MGSRAPRETVNLATLYGDFMPRSRAVEALGLPGRADGDLGVLIEAGPRREATADSRVDRGGLITRAVMHR